MLTKDDVTKLVDLLRPGARPDDDEILSCLEWLRTTFDHSSQVDREEFVDHLLAVSCYASELARTLIDREREQRF